MLVRHDSKFNQSLLLKAIKLYSNISNLTSKSATFKLTSYSTTEVFMTALAPYFAKTGLDRLKSHLPDKLHEPLTKLLNLLDDEGKANVADIHQALFPLAQTASANAMLNRLISEFNQLTENTGHPLRLNITATKNVGAAKRWVWFAGPAQAPMHQPTPDLNAIPEVQLTEQRGLPLNPPIIVLMTFNEHEHAAVLKTFRNKTPNTETRDGITYNRLGIYGDMDVIHVISEAGSGGLGAAQQRTNQAIRAWKPKAVIAVGIAFGMDEQKQAIGNVLISTQLRQYELSRANADSSLTPRASSPDASPCLLNRIRTVDTNAKASNLLDWPKVEFGQILSGEKLVDNLDYRNSLKSQFGPEAIGGEMEGTGLYVAAQAERTDWIVVKAICDWADGNKAQDKEKRQTLAAGNAAKVVKAALDTGNLYSDDPTVTSLFIKIAQTVRANPSKPPRASAMGLKDYGEIPDHLLEHCPNASPTHLRKDDQTEPENRQSVDALAYLLEWTTSPTAPPLFALLGEYGMGKTITCQRLAMELEKKRAENPAYPVPLYFDLRNVTGLDKGVPGQKTIIEECIQRGWHKDSNGETYRFEAITQLLDQGALLILDGLDEVLVKLSEADGQTFTNQLLKLVDDSLVRQKLNPTQTPSRPRLLLSCRTQYFRSLRDQKNHFTGQERGQNSADAYLSLLLLPFSEEQVNRYLANALPEIDPERLLDTLHAIHNLEELTRRPYTLRLVAELIPDIERARAEGRIVQGVSLYRKMAQRWLDRDQGKHHIKPEHKMRLAAHLAAELWRSGKRVMQVADLEAWFHNWLVSQTDLTPRYVRLQPDQLEEDLRTATFLARQDAEQPQDCGFRFAHTSMQEFFLADYLFAAVQNNKPKCWAMDRPSRETLDFLGQMLAEASDPALLSTLQSWRKQYRPQTSELLLDYALVAQAKCWPMPILHGIDLRGAKLRGWQIGLKPDSPDLDKTKPSTLKLDLGPACFAGADLREIRFYQANLDGAAFSEARLQWAEFHYSTLCKADFSKAQLTAAIFRHSQLSNAGWDVADAYRAQFLLCTDVPEHLPQALQAPVKSLKLLKTCSLTLLSGHSGLITACTYSPDGLQLLSAGMDGTLRLWDALSGECLRVLTGHENWVAACAYSPDGLQLLSAGMDGTLRLWDALSGECLRILTGHESEVTACAYSPDGLQLLSAGYDGMLRVWDTLSGECLRVLTGHENEVTACAYSPDGLQVLSAGMDGTLRLWDALSGECLRILTGHENEVTACTYSPDGLQLLSTGMDGTLRLWDALSGECLRVLTGHENWVRACTYSPDGLQLLSTDNDGMLRVWDALSGECLRILTGHVGRATACAYSPDGLQLLSSGMDGTLRLWDALSGECLRVLTGHENWVRACTYSPDGLQLLSTGINCSLMLWDAVSGKRLRAMSGHNRGAKACAYSPDGLQLLSAGMDGTLRLWDALSGECLRILTGHESEVTACAYSPDGLQLLSAGNDGMLRVWDTLSGECLRVLAGHENEVTACTYSPDGLQLLSADNEGSIRLWDALSGECLRVLTGHENWVTACAYSPDGLQLLSSGMDGTLRLWDALSGECIRILTGHENWVTACAYSPDGLQVLSAGNDGMLRVWDTLSGECLRVLTGHEDWVTACAYSPDGLQVLSASDDGTLRLWDATSGECLRIHAISTGEQTGHAVWSSSNNQLIETSGEAWRWLAWQDQQGGRWPLESFGPVLS
jgi:WD40 repeat protein/nucleoside phosphorylase